MSESTRSGHWSLRALLFWQLILIALAPLLAVAVFMFVEVTPQLNDDVRTRQQALTRGAAGQIETHLASAERELTSLAAVVAGERNPQRNGSIDRLLDAVVRNGELYEAIYLLGPNGVAVSVGLPVSRRQAREDIRLVDLSQRAFVSKALKDGEVVWSSTFLSAVSGRLTVAVAIPLPGGALIGEIALPQLSYFLRQLDAAPGTVLMVVDPVGHLIAHPTPGRAGQQIPLSGLDLVRNAFSKGNAFGEANLDGAGLIGSALKIRKIGWVVVVAQPERLANQTIERIQYAFAGGLLFALGLVTVTAALVSRSMAEKFGVYAGNAAAIARGVYQFVWPATKVREFAQLADDLQETADEVRRREQELKTSEQRLLATLESTPNVSIQWFDAQGRVIYWNHSSEALYGVSADKAIGCTLDQLIYSAEEGDAFLDMLRQIARDGLPVGPYESTFRRPDGSEGVVMCTTFAIPGDESGPRFVCMDVDVTQQKRLTRTLEQREKRFRALIEQSPVAVIEWDLNFHVREWNESAEKIFGFSRADALGKHARFIVPASQQSAVEEIWLQLLSSSGGSRSENENVTAAGDLVSCLWYNRAIVDERGAVVAVLSLIEDVTERRRIERALKASEQKFLALFHASPVPVAVSRLDGRVPFTDCNEAWERQFGWQKGEVLGKTGVELGLWIDEGQRLALLDALARRQLVVDLEVSLRHRDGRQLSCLMSGRAIEIDGERMIVFAYHDVTDERRIQQEIRELNASLEQRVESRTEALAQANRELRTTLDTLRRAQHELVRSEKLAALGSLVAGVAHELNTPIGNSLMAASTFDEHAQGFRAAVERGALRRSTLDQFVGDAGMATSIILRNLQKASELVSSFKQVAVDQTSAQRRQFALEEVVSEILLTLRPSFRRTPYVVETNIPAEIHCDSYPGPLGQVLSNLINNALVHAFEGRDAGVVSISAVALPDAMVRIDVSDNGCGIESQYLGRIFDPFFTTRLGQGGSGLGLHIVHNIVSRVLGGRVGVNSSPAGSTFWLEIPLCAPAAVEDPNV